MKHTQKTAALIVAHPDDETLWAGGMMLRHPAWRWFVVCLCRASDTDRAPKFYRALRILRAEGAMGDFDDGPDQAPLDPDDLEEAILDLLPKNNFDLVLTHNPSGEYTTHLRHEEVSGAVIRLWASGRIHAGKLRTFAYGDGGKAYFPRPSDGATVTRTLSKAVWRKKYGIITRIYGFKKSSWEAQTTPRTEAFWSFSDTATVVLWLKNGGKP